jgi:DNA-3-methyladenine glycosylase I
MLEYHDKEWGRPQHNDRALFEFLVLEGAQAGLSWSTILNKRERYRKVFANFEPAKVARFTPTRIARALADPGIVRNRAKIESAVANARAFVRVQREFGSFDAYVWRFVGGKPLRKEHRGNIPATSPEADALSKDLKKRGFTFVGPTICYAFMQAVGMVDDHSSRCAFRNRAAR